MTHASTIPIESAARRCQCLESQSLRSTAGPDRGLGVVANCWLVLALSLAGILIWSGSSHGAWRYGAADLGFLLVGSAFGIGALRFASRAWMKRAYGARQSPPAIPRQCPHALADPPRLALLGAGQIVENRLWCFEARERSSGWSPGD